MGLCVSTKEEPVNPKPNIKSDLTRRPSTADLYPKTSNTETKSATSSDSSIPIAPPIPLDAQLDHQLSQETLDQSSKKNVSNSTVNVFEQVKKEMIRRRISDIQDKVEKINR